MNRGFLVTGTDTGVGKTFVAAGLAGALRERGLRVGVMKPAETGHVSSDDGPWPPDAKTLALAAGSADSIEVVVPYVYEPPVAPLVAARRSGRAIDVDRLCDLHTRLLARNDISVVEGAGGLGVPLAEFGEHDALFDYADLALKLDLPIVVVARAHLGTLNHTFLTLRYAAARNLRVVGVILNGLDSRLEDASVEDNAALIEEMSKVRVLATIPWLEGPVDIERMVQTLSEGLDVDAFLNDIHDLAASSDET